MYERIDLRGWKSCLFPVFVILCRRLIIAGGIGAATGKQKDQENQGEARSVNASRTLTVIYEFIRSMKAR